MSYTGQRHVALAGAFGKIPPYQDVSHFRAPYKNAIFAGLGTDPLACTAPKWVYSESADACLCAPGYLPTPDGRDCIPATPNPVPPTGGLTDPWTFATAPVDPGTQPGATPAPAATCDGYAVAGHCVPKWGLYVGAGVLALVAIKVVL